MGIKKLTSATSGESLFGNMVVSTTGTVLYHTAVTAGTVQDTSKAPHSFRTHRDANLACCWRQSFEPQLVSFVGLLLVLAR